MNGIATEPQTPEHWPKWTGRPVILVGPNPAMDRVATIERLLPGTVHRSSEVTVQAGGKSAIVARSMRRIGAEVAMHGFLSKRIGSLLSDECIALRIHDRHIRIRDETRVTSVIVELETGQSTVFNEPGPMVTSLETQQFYGELIAGVQQDDLVVLTGSLPRGIDRSFYARLATQCSERGAFVAVDASGGPLEDAIAAAPWCVKCNYKEFVDASGLPADSDREAVAAQMLDQTRRGTEIVIVTMGEEPTLVVVNNEVWSVSVPDAEVVNATGSGDTFFGAFIASIWNGENVADALRAATAGGVINASQLEPGLQEGVSLEPYASLITFSTVVVKAVPQ